MTESVEAHPPVRSWEELRSSGLLWLINATVFHPRGFALGIAYRGGDEPIGWCLFGDGTESWRFDEQADPLFAAAEATFTALRRDGGGTT